MSTTAAVQTTGKATSAPAPGPVVQRRCACGGSAGYSGDCEDCRSRKLIGRSIRKKPAVGNPHDAYEREADRVAHAVMRTTGENRSTGSGHDRPISSIQRRIGRTDEGAAVTVPSIVEEVLASSGRPLEKDARAFFERKFGHDFGHIRIHTENRAAQSADAIDALAYTNGHHIVFAQGRYRPQDSGGLRLLAHELTHTIQQGALHEAPIQRQCLTGRTCTEPIAGDPGRFNSSESAAEEGSRATREAEARSDPATAAVSGHGRRAVHLEALAAAEGMDLSPVYGVLVDRDMAPSSGASAGRCGSLEGVVPRFTGPRHAACVFVPEDMERGAGEAMATPRPDRIAGFPREAWIQWIREVFAHEIQHIRYDAATHPDLGTSCSRSTTLYRDRTGYAYTLDFYLSELSAIVAEFDPLFASVRRSTRAGDYGALLDNLQTAYTHHVFNPGESISGILTAIRCHCDCADADAFVRDTFEFTSSAWSDTTRGVFVDFVRSRFPILRWPEP